MRRFGCLPTICVVLLVLFLIGCSLASSTTPGPGAADQPTQPMSTSTPVPSPTLTPTNTILPTATFAAVGAPLVPQSAAVPPSEPITLANASQVSEIVHWETAQGCDYAFCGIAVSPNGNLLAISSSVEGQPKGIYLYDLPGSRGLWYLPGEPSNLLVFSPDSTWLASGSGEVWNTQTGELAQKFTGIPVVENVWGAVFSPDGSRLVVSTSEDLQTWNLGDGSVSSLRDKAPVGIYTMAFSPDGSMIALAYNHSALILVDSSTGEPIDSMQYGRNWFTSLAFSPDGQTLAAGTTDGKALLLKISDLTVLKTFVVASSFWATGLAFSPDGSILVSGEQSTMQLWNVADGKQLANLEISGSFSDYFTFTPDGKSILLTVPNIYTNSFEWFGVP